MVTIDSPVSVWQAVDLLPGQQECSRSGRHDPVGSLSHSANRVARLGRRQVRDSQLAFSGAALSTSSAGCLSLFFALALN